jgi:DNA polymerase V
MRDAVFGLADCNNFYASCERAFDSAQEGRPVVVLSNNDGCVIARSDEAKALGIGMGEPYHLAAGKVRRHDVAVFSANFALYGDMSRRVMETLGRFTPEVEIYSIDEAFLNLRGFERRGLEGYAREIRASVRRWTGLPVSIGLCRTKVLAKVANRLAKRWPEAAGVFDLTDPARLDEALRQTEVGDLWGVGPRWAARLRAGGIATALDLKRADRAWVRRELTVVGERIVCELNGESCLPLRLVEPPRQGITVSRSFGRPLEDLDGVREALAHFVARAAEKLRGQGLAAGRLGVFLHTNPFSATQRYYGNSASMTLPYPTDYTPELLGCACRLLGRIYRPGHPYKKCGVLLTDLSPSRPGRADLFDTRDRDRERRLMQALDAVNAAHGAGTLRFAAAGVAPRSAGKAERRSGRYTTAWAGIPVAKC